MDNNKSIFEDLHEALNEVIEYENGNLSLNTDIISINNNDIEANQLLYQKIQKLPKDKKNNLNQYIDELLRA